MLKRVTYLIAVCLLITITPLTALAGAGSVTFTPTGAKYIFSNNPEPIFPENVAGAAYGEYSIEQPLSKNTSYDAEFFNGNRSYATVSFGIAVKNSKNVPVKFRIISESLGYQLSGLDIFTKVALNYQNGLLDNRERTVIVPPKSAAVLTVIKVPTGNYLNGKIKFIPGDNGTIARVFWIKTFKYSSPKQIFALPKAKPEPDPNKSEWARTTGFFKSDTRYGVVDAAKTTGFYLAANDLNLNPGEYEKGANVTGNVYLRGNYGITYDLVFKNVYDRKIKITPSVYADKAQLIFWTPETGWYRTSLITTKSSQKYWIIPAPAGGRLKFVLPSGNWGNVLAEVI